MTLEQALNTAAEEAPGGFAEADSVIPVLARFTNLGTRPVIPDPSGTQASWEGPLLYDRVLAWIVTLDGVCVPYHGPVSLSGEAAPRPPCAGTELNIVIDATTGEFIQSFSYR